MFLPKDEITVHHFNQLINTLNTYLASKGYRNIKAFQVPAVKSTQLR